jgi:hypothetical protein
MCRRVSFSSPCFDVEPTPLCFAALIPPVPAICPSPTSNKQRLRVEFRQAAEVLPSFFFCVVPQSHSLSNQRPEIATHRLLPKTFHRKATSISRKTFLLQKISLPHMVTARQRMPLPDKASLLLTTSTNSWLMSRGRAVQLRRPPKSSTGTLNTKGCSRSSKQPKRDKRSSRRLTPVTFAPRTLKVGLDSRGTLRNLIKHGTGS